MKTVELRNEVLNVFGNNEKLSGKSRKERALRKRTAVKKYFKQIYFNVWNENQKNREYSNIEIAIIAANEIHKISTEITTKFPNDQRLIDNVKISLAKELTVLASKSRRK